MSGVLLHDSGDGGKLRWALDAIQTGLACGLVLSPFETPPVETKGRRHALRCAQDVAAAGGTVYFDPTTHGAAAPSADKFKIYEDWALWPDSELTWTSQAAREHVKRAIAAGRTAGAYPIAPTIPLSIPIGEKADLAIDMAETSRQEDPEAFLAVAGTEEFWAAGRELDDFIGLVIAMKPQGVSLTAVRPNQKYPWPIDPAEVHGFCRSVHALALRSRVLFMHSDFAGLPGIAAGADCLGSGWNMGGRVFSNDAFRLRRGGLAKPRPTYRGLLASLKRREADTFEARDQSSSERLYPGRLPPPTDKLPHWQHHLRQLSELINEITSEGERRSRAVALSRLYDDADDGFASLVEAVGPGLPLEADAGAWTTPLRDGLRRWMGDEGYVN